MMLYLLNSKLIELAPMLIFTSAGAALAFAIFLSLGIVKKPEGDEKMKKIAKLIHEGAMTFLKTEYSRLTIFVVLLAVFIFFFIDKSELIPTAVHMENITKTDIRGGTAICFLVGSIFSALAGWFGMQISTRANVRTTEACRTDLAGGLSIAFNSGVVMGMVVVGLGILGITGLYQWMHNIDALLGFSLGASSIALFARVGGGIYTKAADVGADLVGKIEAGIPEDDPRNPAVIADNVGDNVGDVAGMGADLFESYVGSIIATMAIGLSIKLDGGDSSIDKIFQGISRDSLLLLPLLVSALGIFASIIGKFIVSTNEESKIGRALFSGLVLASIVVIVGSFLIVQSLEMPLGIFYALISGLILGVMIGKITERYTSMDTPSVLEIAKQAETGPATVVIHGMAVGMQSTMLPTLLICFSIGLSYYFAGLYGIAIAAVGMLSTLGISLGVDAYGPVADNAGGIAEMAGLPKETRARTDALDAAGNTTAAIGKGFAIGSAALTALALFSTYSTQGNLKSIDILDPMVTIGLLIGSALVFLFCSLSMSAVGRAAGRMVEEVRHQFKTIPGLMEGKAEPDSKRCVAISTAALSGK